MEHKRRHWSPQEIAQLRAVFVERWPKLFSPKGEDKKPLKIDVLHDICFAMPELGFDAVRRALADYCYGPTYQRHMTEGAARFDLNGGLAGFVTKAEAEYAANRMKMFKPKKQEIAA